MSQDALPGSRNVPGPSPTAQRALVIDDDPHLREVISEMLEALGYVAHAVGSGEEGLARLERERYDLVVTDLVMPGMTGWEVVGAIRERGVRVPVILASGSIANLDAARAWELGAIGLDKPFRLAAFRAAVDAALARAAVGARPAPASAGRSAGDETGEDLAEPLAAPGIPGSVSRVVDTMRRASRDFQALFTTMEAALGERERLEAEWVKLKAEHERLKRAHEALVGIHESMQAGLTAGMREAHETLGREHEDAIRALEAIRGEADRCLRRLRT